MGYALIAGSVFLLLLGSYAVLFSAFLPLSGVWVRVAPFSCARARLVASVADTYTGAGCARAGHTLQVPRGYARRVLHGVRHRELGGVAVL